MGDDLYELPQGWVWVKFEQLVQEFQNGLSKRKGLQGNATHVLRLADIANGKIMSTEPRDILLTDEEVNKYLLRVNELVCIRVNGSDNLVGRLVIFKEKEPWAFCDHFIKISLIECLISVPYIFYLFNTRIIRDYISLNKVCSAGQNTVSQTTISAVPIPLPPLAEQQRIVAKIDELFTELDAGVELLKKLKAKLKRYRQAVLKAAVEGNLTKEWREANQGKLEPASMLRDRILKQRREKWEAEQLAKMKAQGKIPKDDSWKLKYKEPVAPDTSDLPELPDGWCWATPEQLASTNNYSLAIGPFGSNLKVEDYRDEGFPLVFVKNIRSGIFGDENTKYVTFEKAKALFAHQVEGGDILITKMGDPPGDACLYPLTRPPAIITADCIKWQISEIIYNKSFFVYTINSRIIQTQISQITKGVAQQKVSLARFKVISVPLPPLKEQNYITEKIESRFSVTDQLEKTIDANLKRAEKLRQSILKQAFEGKLVPQDPNDEPAEKLLERIKAEKAKIEAEKKPKRQPKIKSSQPRKSQITAIQLELNFDE